MKILTENKNFKTKNKNFKIEGDFMKTEIEARLLDVNTDEFIKRLKKANANFVGDWLQIRNCYDFKPARKNSWIRLRTTGEETTLTIKEISSSKIDGTKEDEIVVSDFDTCNEILNKLGYFARTKQENRRIRFTLNDVEIDIDMWPKIPDYVEFEAKSEKQIKEVCQILEINYKDLVTLDVESIYNHYGFDLQKFPSEVLLEKERKS